MRSVRFLIGVVGLIVLTGCASKHLAMDSGKMPDVYRGTMEGQIISNLYVASVRGDVFPSFLSFKDGSVAVRDSFTPNLSIPLSPQQSITTAVSASPALTSIASTPSTTLSLGAGFNSEMSFKVSPVDNAVALKRMRALYRCAVYTINKDDFVNAFKKTKKTEENIVDVSLTTVTGKNNSLIQVKKTEVYKEKKKDGNPVAATLLLAGKTQDDGKAKVLDCSQYIDSESAADSAEGCECIYWKYAKFTNRLPDGRHMLPVTSEASMGVQTVFVSDVHVFQDFVQEVIRVAN